MLETVLKHLNNWFPVAKVTGDYSVQSGQISLPFLQDGQYFLIMGSVFNDGLHQYPATDLTDEDFSGVVWALAVPKAVVELSDEIAAWTEKNQPSGFTSESFGGYSYSKATNASGVAAGWQDVFRSRLNDWRRIGGI